MRQIPQPTDGDLWRERLQCRQCFDRSLQHGERRGAAVNLVLDVLAGVTQQVQANVFLDARRVAQLVRHIMPEAVEGLGAAIFAQLVEENFVDPVGCVGPQPGIGGFAFEFGKQISLPWQRVNVIQKAQVNQG